ncbi:MAG: deoxyhypusine synthase family protein [Planctomycetota bacterium]|nr:deoxyhypusine synthase family protein [Planctomycetota bacterium]
MAERQIRLAPDLRQRKKRLLSSPVRAPRITGEITAAALVEHMKKMSIQARNLGACAEVLDGIMRDRRRPTVFLGLAGPLIAAGLREVLRQLIAGGYVDVVVSTGAILYQDIYQARGYAHYRGSPTADDAQLREMYIDRIYDTYVDEEAFWETDIWCGKIADAMPPGAYSSRQFLDFLASRLRDRGSILATCRSRGVPVFCPALNDSSIGIGLTHHRHRCHRERRDGIRLDAIQDNYEIAQIVAKSPATAAIYIAGGVPKNYINDAVVMGYIFGVERGHEYALQISTAVTADGGLSSSTLGEAQSWGKIHRRARFAMAWIEPSVALPLLVAYLLANYPPPARKPLLWRWQGEEMVAH